VPGTVIANASDYTIAMQGVPDEGCAVPAPPAFPVGDCNPLVRRRGTARSFFLVVGGRPTLTGGFYRRDGGACADPSLYTGAVGFGGRPARRDVNDLIVNRRVRSIELAASDTTKFGLKNLPFERAKVVLYRDGEEPSQANPLSVRLELQADCYAGVWAHSVFAAGDLEKGDVREARRVVQPRPRERRAGRLRHLLARAPLGRH
jgi:hypothetical protein